MKHKGGSLLLKIFVTYLVTAITISLVLFGGFRLMQPERSIPEVIERNAIQYLNSLEQKLGERPTIESLRKLNADLLVKVRREDLKDIISQSEDFSDLPTFASVDQDHGHELSNKIKFGRVDSYFYAEIQQQQPRTIWFISTKNFPRAIVFPIAWVLGFILLILIMSFVSIRLIMRPVGFLLRGADELANGNLKFRMPVFKSREFDHIATLFNQIADKLERLVSNKDLLLRDVSHELRSPLTRISVASEMIKDEGLKKSIKEDIFKIDHLISQVLENYKIRSGTIEIRKCRLELNQFIEGLLQSYSNSIPRIIFKGQAGLFGEFDPMMMERALTNIIENAIKYSTKDSAPIVVSLSDESSYIEISVQDSGKGIPEHDLDKIFDPFYRGDKARTPDSASGFGLGLAITKSILDQHEFKIKISSQNRQGTLVRIQLPRS